MHFKTSRKPQGIALIVVLIVVLIATMLGYMGLTMAANDTKIAGGVMDSRSRDAASRSGIEYTLNYLSENDSLAAILINTFIADSSQSILSTHQWIDFSGTQATIVVNDPGFQNIASQPDLSAFKIRILSVDIGTQSGPPSDGIKITFECTAQGRRGDVIVNAATFRAFGLQVPVKAGAGTPTNNFAMFLNGSLANSNMGTNVTGNIYINGNTSLNATSAINVTGSFRVNGDFTSNANVTVNSGNAVIAGNLYTNSVTLKFNQHLVVKNGFSNSSGAINVSGNLQVLGGNDQGGWNSPLTVGGQAWIRDQCISFQKGISIAGDAYFDRCFQLLGGTSTFSNVYASRNGGDGSHSDQLNNIQTTINGVLYSGNSLGFSTTGSTNTISSHAIFSKQVSQNNSGRLTINGNAQFWNGIGSINSGSGITVNGTTFLQANSQNTNGNGGASFGNDLTMKGNIDQNFGSNASSRWSFQAAAPSKKWLYDGSPCIPMFGVDPRVTNSSTMNGFGMGVGGCNTGTTTPAPLFTVPDPTDPTAYATDPYTANDLNLDPTKTWNQVQTTDTSKIGPIIDLTAANLTLAGAASNNLTAADFNKIYDKFKRADGWLVARIGPDSPIASLSSPGTTFNGKALWIITKGIGVNGNWPGSNVPNYQFIWVQTGGSLSSFGSPTHFAGYIRFDPAFVGTMQWGTSTLTGAIHFAGGGSSVTGNSGNLTIVNSQAVFEAIGSEFPSLLGDPSGASSSSSTVSTGKLQSRGGLQFITVANYR